MATRRTAISQEHVAAINLIEVEYHGVKPVIEAWSNYLTHLNSAYSGPGATADQLKRWEERRAELLSLLLVKIAEHLGMSKGELEVLHGGYAPQGWLDRENRITQVQDYVVRLSEGRAVVPIAVATASSPPNPFPPPPP